MQAAGNAFAATIVSVLRQGALLIPLMYLMHTLLGFIGIAAAHTVADVTSALIALAVCLREYRKMLRQESPSLAYDHEGMSY